MTKAINDKLTKHICDASKDCTSVHFMPLQDQRALVEAIKVGAYRVAPKALPLLSDDARNAARDAFIKWTPIEQATSRGISINPDEARRLLNQVACPHDIIQLSAMDRPVCRACGALISEEMLEARLVVPDGDGKEPLFKQSHVVKSELVQLRSENDALRKRIGDMQYDLDRLRHLNARQKETIEALYREIEYERSKHAVTRSSRDRTQTAFLIARKWAARWKALAQRRHEPDTHFHITLSPEVAPIDQANAWGAPIPMTPTKFAAGNIIWASDLKPKSKSLGATLLTLPAPDARLGRGTSAMEEGER